VHEQPGPAEPEIDLCKIETIFLDHELLDGGKLLPTSLVDIAGEVVDLLGQHFERSLRAYEMGCKIALSLKEVL
jgi:hypothetical protein